MGFLKSKKGFEIGNIIYYIVGIVIAVAIIPVAITSINDSKGNYTASQQSLLDLVPLMLVIALIVGALVVAGLKLKQ
jgi:uncharacterized membrane protein YciS (DUF1049 family)